MNFHKNNNKMEKSRIAYWIFMVVLIIYIFRPRDYCKEGREMYKQANVSMKLAKISSIQRGMYLEGYNPNGNYFRWNDKGNLIFHNSEKIEIGDSIIKFKKDSVFTIKKNDGSIIRFQYKCGY